MSEQPNQQPNQQPIDPNNPQLRPIQLDDLIIAVLKNPYEGVSLLYQSTKNMIAALEQKLKDEVASLIEDVADLKDRLGTVESELSKLKNKKK